EKHSWYFNSLTKSAARELEIYFKAGKILSPPPRGAGWIPTNGEGLRCQTERRAGRSIFLSYPNAMQCDARRLRSNDVTNRRGLPASGRGRLKKRVQLQLRLGTINIGTMTGRSRELADALKSRRIDIACVQETKWTGTKARDIGEGYKLHYNGTKAQNGVGIV
ncbi:craniofacial development protein 2-like protein, partial [Dinothrombium tinctorium]